MISRLVLDGPSVACTHIIGYLSGQLPIQLLASTALWAMLPGSDQNNQLIALVRKSSMRQGVWLVVLRGSQGIEVVLRLGTVP